MPITVRCSCGKSYQVADKLAGKKFRCKSCESVLAVKRPVARTKVNADRGDPDSGFMDVDLDAEFAQMTEVARQAPESRYPESQFAHPSERFGLKEAGLDRPDESRNQPLIPEMPLVEKIVAKLLPLLGVCLGLGMIAATYLLIVHAQLFWPFLGVAGIIVTIVFLNKLLSGDEDD